MRTHNLPLCVLLLSMMTCVGRVLCVGGTYSINNSATGAEVRSPGAPLDLSEVYRSGDFDRPNEGNTPWGEGLVSPGLRAQERARLLGTPLRHNCRFSRGVGECRHGGDREGSSPRDDVAAAGWGGKEDVSSFGGLLGGVRGGSGTRSSSDDAMPVGTPRGFMASLALTECGSVKVRSRI